MIENSHLNFYGGHSVIESFHKYCSIVQHRCARILIDNSIFNELIDLTNTKYEIAMN